MSIKIQRKVTVDLTAAEWQLYGPDDDLGAAELRGAARGLNAAAGKALSAETRDKAWTIFLAACERYAAVGACDTEPRAEFAAMLDKVFGNDEKGW
jgi:hypothetical protein